MADSTETETGIAFSSDVLQNEGEALRREWLVTNGIGGYASGTLAGANTRRYHGLLVAALNPPLGRAVLLSKLDETLTLTDAAGNAASYELSSNLYPDVTHPRGFQWLQTWTDAPAPTWIWTPAPGWTLEKSVWMMPEQNTAYIRYRLKNAPSQQAARLTLTPLLAWRDYHSEMRACNPVPTLWTGQQTQQAGQKELPCTLLIKLPPIHNVNDHFNNLRLRVVNDEGAGYPQAEYVDAPAWYYRFQHPREQERGLDFEEDLFAPGAFTVTLAAGESAVFVATTERAGNVPSPDHSWRQIQRINNSLFAKTSDEFTGLLSRAAQQFLVEVPGKRATIIAGYPWFADWGRDTMIALPGLCLATRHYALARNIFLSFARYVSQGMLPNRFPDAGETPEYNTVDATLWYFVALHRYVEATGDTEFLTQLWDVLQQIVAFHQRGTRYNIHVDPRDSLLYAGEAGVQLTWMDAKVGDWVVTPRIGKPVEINALWVNALYTMADFARVLVRLAEASVYQNIADFTRLSFVARFARPDGNGLYDVLDTPPQTEPDASVRPNQIFALSLPFAPLQADSQVAASVVRVVHEELLTPVGLRTLSPRDPAYRPRYEGDQWNRDGAYHQGTVWPWLLGAFAEAVYKTTDDRAAALSILLPLQSQLDVFGIGSLAEIYDGSDPQRPNGCIAQAWSVAETLRVWQQLHTTE